jgi:hypothetical protein
LDNAKSDFNKNKKIFEKEKQELNYKIVSLEKALSSNKTKLDKYDLGKIKIVEKIKKEINSQLFNQEN